ncbi:putative DNA-binding domain-containing protein [Roseovarius sp. SYSU LYC5161]|uniref:HvfC/BufC family peptide modification chaperone n=1 Tax=Roseovarius halophilus (ex Wu et al. 2025) TaxID=3376060 RepID=UPI0028724149|nr:DNA-binding domain-containing protein [Roseovarius sp.]
MSISQTYFHDALLDSGGPVPAGLSDGHGRPAGQRFAVYRNNVAVSLTEALETGFPAIANLIGADNFRKVAGVFLRQHPPKTPLMMQYGAALPDFLDGFEPVSHIRYIGDVARLEHAQITSYHAADATPVAPAALEALPPDKLAAARLGLAPALRLLRSPWPVHDIYCYATMPDAPKPRAVAQDVLITRPEYDPQITVLPDGVADFMAALAAGQPMATANEAAMKVAAEFDLSQALVLLLNGRAITHITPED